jgi:hypothetical protein
MQINYIEKTSDLPSTKTPAKKKLPSTQIIPRFQALSVKPLPKMKQVSIHPYNHSSLTILTFLQVVFLEISTLKIKPQAKKKLSALG